MNLTDFYDQVERDEALKGIGVVLGDSPDLDVVVVRDVAAGYTTRLLADTIRSHPWDVLRDVILGLDPAPLYHDTRIVGYFSRIENWNKSKLGELRDRRNGNYRVSAEQIAKHYPER